MPPMKDAPEVNTDSESGCCCTMSTTASSSASASADAFSSLVEGAGVVAVELRSAALSACAVSLPGLAASRAGRGNGATVLLAAAGAAPREGMLTTRDSSAAGADLLSGL